MKKRFAALDELRGFALINMIFYHAIWDLVYLFGVDWQWYRSQGAFFWQQGICCTFIFLSGFCYSLGKKKWERGMLVFLAGALITVVTVLLMPQDQVLFGVLTLIGSCMILLIPFEPTLKRIPPVVGILVSLVLFALFRNITDGYLGIGSMQLLALPEGWYSSLFTAYFGMPMQGFYSTDYFPLLPWIFLYGAGYFTHGLFRKKNWMDIFVKSRIKPLGFLGRHSLLIYMLHQPVIYGVLWLIFK